MRLTTKCSIALHCLIFISEYEGHIKVTSELLSKSTGCNASAVRSILNHLKKAGIIRCVRGIGGAHLEQDPDTLTLWDIYRALEPDGLAHMIGLHPHPSESCPVGRNIETVLEGPYHEIGNAVCDTMKGISLQQLIDEYHARLQQH